MYNHYKLIKEQRIKNMNGTGYLLEHEKSGAKVFVISNDDDNKVFNIAFRTPPADDTGLPHILEHSVLCGSDKYPLKDPFVELAKGSLNTFLNAMTYPDKTLYPVASCNSKDFRNLTDVYLNAVFYPNIYKDPRILEQEGWHYELDSLEGEVIFNGVVYNEMKGASSSPEQVLFRQIQAVLFPEHPYGYDSGGRPSAITDLTLDQFLDFHKKYYHPSNSFIYFYGDMDLEEQLTWLDREYLSNFDRIEVDSALPLAPAFTETVRTEKSYAVASDAGTDKKTYISYNVAFEQPEAFTERLGIEVLEYLLMEAPGAPLKQALLDLSIAEDIFGSYDSGLNQPTFSIIGKNTNPEDEALFVKTIEEVLLDLVKKGIDRRKLEAAINNFEFKVREADFGQYPKGIIYIIKALDTWLYDRDPFANFDYDNAFDQLKQGVGNGYFEGLIHKYILSNTHKAILQLKPDPGFLEAEDQEAREKLSAYEAQLSEEGRKELIERTKALKSFQETPNTPEEMATIPLLAIEDIDKEGPPINYKTEEEEGVTYVIHETFTNNIVYGDLLFDFSHLTFDEVPYVGLLSRLLTKVDTEHYSYASLNDEINLQTGGIKVGTNVFGMNNNPNECQTRMEIKFKCFSEKLDEALSLVEEVVTKSLLTDSKRLYEIIGENRSRLSMTLMRSGHQAAIARALSYHTVAGKYRDLLDGIAYFRFLEAINGIEAVEGLKEKLAQVASKVLSRTNLTVMLNTEAGLMTNVKDRVGFSVNALTAFEPSDTVEEQILFEQLNEGFKSSSKVQYNALTADFTQEGYLFTGHMPVLQTLMSLGYMWTEVRVKGGAYGGFAGFRRGGTFYMGSYRDPNLKGTYEIYRQLPDYIRNLKLDEREMTKYIIGTISQRDTPLTPSMKGDKALGMFMSEVTAEDLQKERDEILSTNPEDLKALADLIEKLIDQNNICVIGNESKIEAEKDVLETIEPLFSK